MALKTT
jgi:hypothetical protein